MVAYRELPVRHTNDYQSVQSRRKQKCSVPLGREAKAAILTISLPFTMPCMESATFVSRAKVTLILDHVLPSNCTVGHLQLATMLVSRASSTGTQGDSIWTHLPAFCCFSLGELDCASPQQMLPGPSIGEGGLWHVFSSAVFDLRFFCCFFHSSYYHSFSVFPDYPVRDCSFDLGTTVSWL